jgi:pimeloyl-ACP methyl ester carboxylesterase
MRALIVSFAFFGSFSSAFYAPKSVTPNNLRSMAPLNLESGKNLKVAVEGGNLCYDLLRAKSPAGPPIVYLPGLSEKKNQALSTNLQSFCKKNEFSFLCADYFGIGRSDGKLSDGCVSRWASDTITLLDKLLSKENNDKAILVGRGVGAWISFVVAAKRPDRVAGIVGMAADPDFTEELLWKSFDEDMKKKITSAADDATFEITWGQEKYTISKNLIMDGRKNLLLSGSAGSVPVKCPIRLIHGVYDEEVPYTIALKLLENCKSRDGQLVLLKTSSHAMEVSLVDQLISHERAEHT